MLVFVVVVVFFCWGKKWQEAKAFHYCFWLNHLQVVFPGTMDFIAACSAETASCDWVNSPWRLHEQEPFLALEEVEKKQRCASKVEWFQLDFLSYFTVFCPKVKFLRIRHAIFEAKFTWLSPFQSFFLVQWVILWIIRCFNLRVWRYECEDDRFFSWRKKQPLWKARKTFLSPQEKQKQVHTPQ